MNFPTIVTLAIQGLAVGVCYLWLAAGGLWVFRNSKVLWFPLGEVAMLAAWTLSALGLGQSPGTALLVAGLALAAAGKSVVQDRHRKVSVGRRAGRALLILLWPMAAAAAAWRLPQIATLSLAGQVLLTLALMAPLGGLLQRLVYEPLVRADTSTVLVASAALQAVLMGLAPLVMSRSGGAGRQLQLPSLWDIELVAGRFSTPGHPLLVIGVSVVLAVLLALLSTYTLRGLALRSAIRNPAAAALVGISSAAATRLLFTIATTLAALAGVLMGPMFRWEPDTGLTLALAAIFVAWVTLQRSWLAGTFAALGLGLLGALSRPAGQLDASVLLFVLLVALAIRALRQRSRSAAA